MKIMGLPTWLHWVAWFCKQFIYLAITAVLIVIILKVRFGLCGYLYIIYGQIWSYASRRYLPSIRRFFFFIYKKNGRLFTGDNPITVTSVCAELVWVGITFVPIPMYCNLKGRESLCPCGPKFLLKQYLSTTVLPLVLFILCSLSYTTNVRQNII